MPFLKLPKPIIVIVVLLCLSSILSLSAIIRLGQLTSSFTPTEPRIKVSHSPIFSNKIVVDIQGAVTKPGVYQIKEESRLLDALNAAGGLSSQADRYLLAKTFNLAKLLADGEKIYLPSLGEASGDLDVQGALVSMNSASKTQLELLPGIGPITAAKIIERRPYSTFADLVSRKALGQKTLEKIIDQITL